MEKKDVGEFVAAVGADGKIVLPADLRELLEKHRAHRVHVRVSPLVVQHQLIGRGVGEPEIETMCSTQLETREQVVKFLLSEGAMKDNAGFVRRAKALSR